MRDYTEKQKAQLDRIALTALYRGFLKVSLLQEVLEEIARTTSVFPWFSRQDNLIQLLKHLEEAGVAGMYEFDLHRQTRLYFSLIFPQSFFAWAGMADRSMESFLSNVPKAKPHKPNPKDVAEKISSKYRMHNAAVKRHH
jgi:hypothetical protein